MEKFSQAFAKFATAISRWTGRPAVFAACLVLVVLWAVSGPLFGFSDTWQLVINTSTTIVTFLMVFLIQNTQNRDNNALHAKLDELIRISKAENALIGIENLPDKELEAILADYDKVAAKVGGAARRQQRPRAPAKAAAGKAGAARKTTPRKTPAKREPA